MPGVGMSTSQTSSPDIQPQRDNCSSASSSLPAELQGFFNGWCDRYTVLEVVGKGSYGTVCSAVDNLTGEKVAIKKIQNVFDNVADATRILREIKLLRLLKHPDVVEIKHILLPSDPRTFKDLYVVFELMESDLHTVIGANDDLTPDHHKVFLYQLLRGLNFIHGSGVLHRDLKPKNILANSNCKLKICDFGLARPFISDVTASMSPVFWTDYVATRWYRAPELCGCFYGRYSTAVDIWSIGCIFAETLLGKPLFPGRDAVSQLQLITDLMGKPSPEVVDRISNSKARAFLHSLPNKPGRPFEHVFQPRAADGPRPDPLALDLLRRLLSFDPADRPTASEALAHPYFNGLPNATSQQAAIINKQQFDFELHKLTENEVRHLIYMEVLNYHPKVQATYKTSQRTSHYVPANTAADDVKRQFILLEQYGSNDVWARSQQQLQQQMMPPSTMMPPPPQQQRLAQAQMMAAAHPHQAPPDVMMHQGLAGHHHPAYMQPPMHPCAQVPQYGGTSTYA